MSALRVTGCMALAVGMVLAEAGTDVLYAITVNELERLPSMTTLPAPDVGPSELSSRNMPTRAAEPTGNPLWAVPMSALTATRERPLFSPSRRPPAPVVAGAPPPAPIRMAAPPPEPDRPHLALVGTIAGESGGGIGVFVDETTRNFVRLKTGEGHSGWILTAIRGREATLQKDRETTTLALPAPGAEPTGPALPTVTAIPGMIGIPGMPPAPTRPPVGSTTRTPADTSPRTPAGTSPRTPAMIGLPGPLQPPEPGGSYLDGKTGKIYQPPGSPPRRDEDL